VPYMFISSVAQGLTELKTNCGKCWTTN
jgi:hypothetical protein